MEHTDETPTEEETQADGYYGDDDVDADELDLSFLDEDDDEDDEPKPSK